MLRPSVVPGDSRGLGVKLYMSNSIIHAGLILCSPFIGFEAAMAFPDYRVAKVAPDKQMEAFKCQGPAWPRVGYSAALFRTLKPPSQPLTSILAPASVSLSPANIYCQL